MSMVETRLLDETDWRRRVIQHGALFAGIGALVAALAVVDDEGGRALAFGAIAGGLALFTIASFVKQRWAVTYKGHEIRFENNPFSGEKLFIDGAPAAKGRLGVHSEMRARLPEGDEIVVRSTAGLFRLQCRIDAVPR